MGTSEKSHVWGRGPDSKGLYFSVSPEDTGKTFPCGSMPGAWGEDLPQGPSRGSCPWQGVGTADRGGWVGPVRLLEGLEET